MSTFFERNSWLHVTLHALMFVQHDTQGECKSIVYSMAYANLTPVYTHKLLHYDMSDRSWYRLGVAKEHVQI